MAERKKLDRVLEYKRIQIKYKDLPLFSDLDKLGYFDAPASTKYHGSYEGGLFDHSYEVTGRLLWLTDKLSLIWQNKRSPYLIGLFHDFCKINQYEKKPDEIGYDYNAELIIPGHGDRSVILLQQYIDLTAEEIACIRWHMGPYEKDTRLWTNYGAAVKAYPNILFAHMADEYASKVIGV